MAILENKEHFLHQHVQFMESMQLAGQHQGFNNYLSNLGIPNRGDYWDTDHSNIDWNSIERHYQFSFDGAYNAPEIKTWLVNSRLSDHEYLSTWLDWGDPIVKIRTKDFIEHWEVFYNASIDGMVLTTLNGEYFMEFTDDWKHHLNSNFKICPK